MSNETILFVSIFLYFAIVLFLGIRTKTNPGSEGFTIAERKAGGLRLGASVTVSWVDALYLSWYAEIIYQFQLAGALTTIAGIVIGLIATSFIAKELRNTAAREHFFTLPDYYEYKFSRRCAVIVLIANTFGFLVWNVAQFYVGGTLIEHFSSLTFNEGVFLMASITLPYLLIGGFKSVLATDFFQFIILFILGIILFSVTLLSPNAYDLVPQIGSLAGMSGDFLFANLLLLPLWIFVSGELWQRVYAAKDGETAQKGMLWGAITYILMAIPMLSIFILARNLVDTNVVDASGFMFFAFQTLLDSHFTIILALILIVAAMSSLDTTVFASAMGISNDIAYRFDWIRKEQIRPTARIATFVIVVLSAFAVRYAESVIAILLFMMEALSVFAPLTIASFWTRIQLKESSAFYSMLIGYLTFFAKLIFWQDVPYANLLPLAVATLTLMIVQKLPLGSKDLARQ